MVPKLACNGCHWVVIQYSHSASPLRFANQSQSTSVLVSHIGPRCQVPLFGIMAPASCNCILRILLRKRLGPAGARSLREARFQCFAGTYLCHVAGNTSIERKIFRFIPQRVGPAPSGPLWRGCAILLIRPDELPELNRCSGRFAFRELLRPALSRAAASPAEGRTCLRSTSSAYVCLCQSACTPIRLQPKRAAKEPPRGDHHSACIAGWIQTSARPTSHPHLPFAAHLHGMRG